jgi:sirohydrochlorin ferrochelatase
MTGVLILAHGSRAKETEETLEKIVAMVRDILGWSISPALFCSFPIPTCLRGYKNWLLEVSVILR